MVNVDWGYRGNCRGGGGSGRKFRQSFVRTIWSKYTMWFKSYVNFHLLTTRESCACTDPVGDRGSGPPSPWKITKLPGVSAIPTGIPWKTTKLQCWVIIGLPAKRHLNGVLLVGRWWPAFTLGGSEKYTWPILLICIVDKSLCEACPVSFRVFIFVI